MKLKIICGAIVMALFSHPVVAIETSTAKSIESAIEQAEELVLKSKRRMALSVLSIEWEKAKGPAKNLLATKMEELGRVFMTERGQKAYELGQSMSLDKAALAEGHYNEALKSEDANISILFALVALKIREKSWATAIEMLDSILKIVPSSREAKVLKLKTLLVSKNFDEAELLFESLQPPLKKGELDELQVELWMGEQKLIEAEAKLTELLKKQPENSEIHYLRWKLNELKGQPAQSDAETYLELCKKTPITTQKQLSQNPFKCLEELEVTKILDEIEPQTR